MPVTEQVPAIDWNNQAIEFLPASHRTPRFIAWFQGMISGSNAWLNQNFWNYCYGDNFSSFFDPLITYSLNSIVVGSISSGGLYSYDGVYISLSDGNIGNSPLNSPSQWYKISPSYIGAQERAQYNAQKIIMEYALNRWFLTTFKQPTAFTDGTASSPLGIWYTPTSDIFITTKPITELTFYSGETEASSSYSRETDSGTWYSTETVVLGSDTTYYFIVWIPTALSIRLGLEYEKIISKVVNLMRIEGTIFQIELY